MSRRDGVVPVAVKLVWRELNARERRVVHLNRLLVASGVERRFHDEARARAGVRDQVDDHLMARQRLPAPVLRDEAEEAMLDLVPLAGPWREVADPERQVEVVR